MTDHTFINDLLAAIDRKDAAAFAAFLTPDANFCFGNNPAIAGRRAIETAVAAFFEAIKSVSHRLENQWSVPDAAICIGVVTYTRHDGSTLRVPFANVMKLRSGGICDYLIFTDNSALFAV
jgi:uncharacterized protein (TIGR02246 family)